MNRVLALLPLLLATGCHLHGNKLTVVAGSKHDAVSVVETGQTSGPGRSTAVLVAVSDATGRVEPRALLEATLAGITSDLPAAVRDLANWKLSAVDVTTDSDRRAQSFELDFESKGTDLEIHGEAKLALADASDALDRSKIHVEVKVTLEISGGKDHDADSSGQIGEGLREALDARVLTPIHSGVKGYTFTEPTSQRYTVCSGRHYDISVGD